MPGCLLDTNVCISLLRSHQLVHDCLRAAGVANCFISEITVAELYFGAEKSPSSAREYQRIQAFVASAQVLLITPARQVHAQQRWRWQQLSQPLDGFNLLIGATAIANNLVMGTQPTPAS